ncbi:MAG: hypothetical protein ACOX80_02640 [Methanomassiliicoccaceae archaeon]|nr:hypothetical protein [Euryarchaeota archaeon]HOB38733.1 hypothetical protein [Methanomassiliicoccaceae archaeon]HOL07126.1 hypothetical protein [Methanomassiliicoccaceae archaeon]HOQ25563.1 hypothetical protein [Methanomassiliicoccaceae archaeon]HPP45343.1 hypothetical protein [Methanomassiliicoccaceae archaeon]
MVAYNPERAGQGRGVEARALPLIGRLPIRGGPDRSASPARVVLEPPTIGKTAWALKGRRTVDRRGQ